MKRKLSEIMHNSQRELERERPLININEIRIHIDNKPITNIPVSANHAFRLASRKGIIIMSTIGSVITAGIIALIMMTGTQTQATGQEETPINLVMKQADNAPNSMHTLSDDAVNNTSIPIYRGIPILHLSDTELEKIGVIREGNNYKIRIESHYDSAAPEELARHGYDTTDSNTMYYVYRRFCSIKKPIELIDGKGQKITQSCGITPLMLKSSNIDGHSNFSYGFWSMTIKPETEMANKQFRDDFDKLHKSLFIGKDELDLSEVEYIDVKGRYFPFSKYAIPIKLSLPATEHAPAKPNTLLWYAPTPQFLDALPKRYHKYIRAYYDISDQTLINEEPGYVLSEEKDYANARNKYISQKSFKEMNNTEAIPAITLTDDEMAKLMLYRSNSGDTIIFPTEGIITKDAPQASAMMQKFGIDTSNSVVKIIMKQCANHNGTGPYGNPTQDFVWSADTSGMLKTVPVGLTLSSDRYDGSKWHIGESNTTYMASLRYIHTDIDSDIMQLLKEGHDRMRQDPKYMKSTEWGSLTRLLLPVSINFGSREEIQGNRYSSMLLWYFPSEDFIQLLPDRYAVPIREELDALLSIINGEKTIEEACKGLSGQSYFGICDMHGMVNNLVSYPNPATDGIINIKFILEKSSDISIALYDAAGNIMKILVNNQRMDKGEISGRYILGDVPKGFYQLVVSAGKGEQAMAKVIVK